jgi:hypothetical protein
MNYQNHYDNLINRARVRALDCYTEGHHIIPRCIGGTDNPINLVELTPEEHYVAHQFLIKIFPNEAKIVLAARYMTNGNKKNGGRTNNRMYGWLKRKFSEAMREINTGRKQSAETILKRQKSREWYVPTEETNLKISLSNKGKHNHTRTEETKRKISESQIGRPSGMLGKHHSEDRNKKLSEKMKGTRTTLKTREGQSNSEEHRKKISESKRGVKRENFTPHNKGAPMSEEQKKKIAETKRLNRLNKKK